MEIHWGFFVEAIAAGDLAILKQSAVIPGGAPYVHLRGL